MKLFKSITLWVSTGLLVILLLSGCEASPTRENVQSKNNALFNERIHKSEAKRS